MDSCCQPAVGTGVSHRHHNIRYTGLLINKCSEGVIYRQDGDGLHACMHARDRVPDWILLDSKSQRVSMVTAMPMTEGQSSHRIRHEAAK